MSLHDPCPVRNRPQVHAAVRSLLARMNIEVIEPPLHGARSVCCGDSFYPALPPGQIEEKMRLRAASMPCQDVAVTCVSCIKAMAAGGKTPRHLMDLLYGDPTPPGNCDVAAWHGRLDAYIAAH